MKLPLVLTPISAGFPNPAEDAQTIPLDINALLIQRPASTYMMRVSGDSMEHAGVLDGDVVVVDKSLTPRSGDIVVAYIDAAFTLKYFQRQADEVLLVPANPKYQPIRVSETSGLEIWGVVTGSLRNYRN